VIEHEVDRLQHLTDRFLSLGRVPEPQFTIIAAQELVARALAVFEPSIKGQPIELTRRLAPEPAFVRADPEQMMHVLLNMLANAAEAIPGGGRIDVDLRRVLSDDGESPLAEISVKDTGPGVATQSRGRLFQPFYTTKPSGSGLGLSLAKQVIERHRGDIHVESNGGGARFIVRLPIAPAAVSVT
jgi:signal transduction histidine kinase